jgi:hypothetical protein
MTKNVVLICIISCLMSACSRNATAHNIGPLAQQPTLRSQCDRNTFHDFNSMVVSTKFTQRQLAAFYAVMADEYLMCASSRNASPDDMEDAGVYAGLSANYYAAVSMRKERCEYLRQSRDAYYAAANQPDIQSALLSSDAQAIVRREAEEGYQDATSELHSVCAK